MADIQLDSITNSTGTGVFDKLLNAVSTTIESQYQQGRITGSDYANVYLGSVQAVLQQSIQFVLAELLTEAQIDDVIAGTALKNKQIELAEVERLAKVYEKDTLLVDQHTTNIKQQLLLDTEEQAKQYEVDNILPANLAQIQKQTDVAERNMIEQESTGAKQRLVLDQDIAIKTYENVTLQPDQHTTNLKQQILLDTQEESEQYKVDNLLPEELGKLQEESKILAQKVVGKKQSAVISE